MADLGNTAVISPTDASNGSGTMPSWLGSAAPSTIDDAGRAIQGAIAREWENRSYPTATGTAPAFVVTYTVAPAALRSGQTYTFTAHAAAVGTDTLNANALGAKGIKKVVAGVKTATAANDFYTNDKIACVYDGTDMVWSNRQGAGATAATTTEQLTGTSTTVSSTPDSVAALWEKGSDIASAGTISIGEGGYHHVTGTTTITDIDFATAKDGRPAVLVFDGILTLTHNATTLPLPGSANIPTAAGDILMVWQDATDNVKTTFHKISGAAVVVSSSGYPPGHIFDLTMSNAADTLNDITIAAGSARDEADTENLVLAAPITKQLDAAWAVGDNQGGINTGAEAVSTWYEVILIKRTDTGVVDVMFSTTANRATLPTNYTKSRRIGWIRNDAASAILQFTQVEDHFTLTTQVNDVSATMTSTATAVTLTAPPSSIARFRASMKAGTAGTDNDDQTVVFSEIVEGNVTPTVDTGIASLTGMEINGAIDETDAAGHFELRVSSTSTIEHDSSANGTGIGTFDISTFGWIDHRRRLSGI